MNAREKGRFVGYALKAASRDVRRCRFRGIVKRSLVSARFRVAFERLPRASQLALQIATLVGASGLIWAAVNRGIK